eukprot:2960355-Amphidinium_carterae.1
MGFTDFVPMFIHCGGGRVVSASWTGGRCGAVCSLGWQWQGCSEMMDNSAQKQCKESAVAMTGGGFAGSLVGQLVFPIRLLPVVGAAWQAGSSRELFADLGPSMLSRGIMDHQASTFSESRPMLIVQCHTKLRAHLS